MEVAREITSHISKSAARWPIYISRAASVVFLLLFLFVYRLCYCPYYYHELAMLGLLPLAFGPRLYRWLGIAIIVISLLRAEGEREGAFHVKQIQAEAEAQSLHEYQLRRSSPAPR